MEIIIRQPLTFSEIGRKDNQEDNVYPSPQEVNSSNRFFILCDGMGGHDNGEVASDTVCRALGRYFETHAPVDGIATTEYFNAALAYAYDELDKKDNGSVKKMGTTMTCLYLHKKGCLVAHIGDSRIYHVRPESTDLAKGRLGIIYQSSDHSLVNDLLKAGELTEEEAINFPQKNVITRAMQSNLERRYKADVFSFSDVKSGDYFFLCSDGVLEQLTNERLCEILASPTSDEEKLEAIKQVCYGKTKDNFTCYLIPIANVVAEAEDTSHDEELIVAGVELDEEVTDNNYRSAAKEELPPVVKPASSAAPAPAPSEKKSSSLLKLLFASLLVVASLAYAGFTWWGSMKESRAEDNPQGTFRMMPPLNVSEPKESEEQEKQEEPNVVEEVSVVETSKPIKSVKEVSREEEVEQEIEQPQPIVVPASVEESEETTFEEENVAPKDETTPEEEEKEITNTKDTCIYEKIQSSKEENTESSDSSVAVDSDVPTKLSL